MSDIFKRSFDSSSFDKPLADFSSVELVALVTREYPNDPIGAITSMVDNKEIGHVLYHQTKTILEGIRYDKKKQVHRAISL